jgi:uncharacterized protein with FMN-binding domain
MRRALPAIAGTVLGLAALLGYKSTPPRGRAHSVSMSVSAPPSTSPSTSPPPPTAPTTSKAPVTTLPTERTVDGPAILNRYGTVQVEVKVRGGRLLDVTAVQLPQDRQRSAEISSIAGPILRSEALATDGTRIDSVSGATYTSDGYARSLQAALDAARR